jgi:hypothetical protein
MKKTVLTFGLIAGVMISVLMDGSLLLANKIGSGHNSMVLGYTMMVASFLLVYFGIRSYRDNTLAGQISFGRAFACGILITLITTVCYVATWEILYFNFMPHFMDSYVAAQIHKVSLPDLTPSPPPRRSLAYSTLSSSTRTPSSIWPTPSWSPCLSALSLLSSPLPSSAAKLLSNPRSLPQR